MSATNYVGWKLNFATAEDSHMLEKKYNTGSLVVKNQSILKFDRVSHEQKL